MQDNTNAIEGLRIAIDVQIKLNVISKPLGQKLADAIRLIKKDVLDEEDTDDAS